MSDLSRLFPVLSSVSKVFKVEGVMYAWKFSPVSIVFA